MRTTLAWLNLAIVFCVELAAALWGLFCAPRAMVALPRHAIVGIKLGMLGAAALALTGADHPHWPISLVVLALITASIARQLPNPMAGPVTEG